MKGSNSRFSHTPGKRYSNIAHVMGGMVTDADLTEAGQIHQVRDETTNLITIGSGVPAERGAVAISSENDIPNLKSGLVIAEGKQGLLAPADAGSFAKGMELFKDQADLPLGPPPPEKRAMLYADLWERPIFASEEGYLADAGLHGSETTYRTRTMTQIKAVSIEDDADIQRVLNDLQNHNGLFAKSGNGLAVLKPKNLDIAVDACDPCADQVSAVQTLPNALFRLEIIRVDRNNAEAPKKIQLAWSFENAEAIADVSIVSDKSARDAFAGRSSAFEFFSNSTDAQIGRFQPEHFAERPVFSAELTEVPDKLAGSNSAQAFSHIRRWDGSAVADMNNIKIEEKIGVGNLSFKAKDLQLTTDFFTLELAIDGKEILAGDYWLVELRRYAQEADQLLLVGADNEQAKPVGVQHYFCPLYVINEGVGEAVDDATRRRLSLPPLSNVPATHVGFDNSCPEIFKSSENVQEALDTLCDLSAEQINFDNKCQHIFGDANDVQEALDELCALNAEQIAFDPPENCERFKGTKTISDALEKLCKIEDNSSLTRVLCTMMDWGVLCGLRVKADPKDDSNVILTSGTILDRSGRIIEVPGGAEFLNKLTQAEIHGNLKEIQARDGEICLSVAVDDVGILTMHLSDRKTAFGSGNLSFQDTVNQCIEGKKGLRFGDTIRGFNKDETKVFGDMINVWRHRKTLDGHVPMSSNERIHAGRINSALLENFGKEAPEEAEKVKVIWSRLEDELNPDSVLGEARPIKRMRLEVAKLAVLENSQEEYRRQCECESLFISCPTKPEDGPHLVPVACVKLETFDPGNIILAEVCDLCCRKQSMNWRFFEYHYGGRFTEKMNAMKKSCCSAIEPPGSGGIGDWLDRWTGDLDRIPVTIPVIPPIEPDFPRISWPRNRVPGLPPGIGDPGIIRYPFDGDLINIRPKVNGIDIGIAEDTLTGNGYDLVETISISDGNPLDAMAKYSVGKLAAPLIDRAPQPGDKVILFESGGEAVDYLVVEKGEGVLPFTQKSELIQIDAKIKSALGKLDIGAVLKGKAEGGITREEFADIKTRLEVVTNRTENPDPALADARLKILLNEAITSLDVGGTVKAEVASRLAITGVPSGIPIAELGEFETRLGDLIARKSEMEVDIESLSGERNAIEANVAELSTIVGTLARNQNSIAAAIEASSADLAKLNTLKSEALEGINSAKGELEAARKQQQEFVVDMRKSQPIEAVITNKTVIAKLKAKGVVTVEELKVMNTNSLKRVLLGTNLDASTMKKGAGTFITR